MIEELEHENRLMRARNERLEQEHNHVMSQYRELLIQQGKTDAAVRKLHDAKGRYHTQLAACELFELLGLPSERPKK